MKKLLGILVLGLFLITPANSKNIGEGNLKMDDWLIKYFQKYIKTRGGNFPETFVVAVDGSYAVYWYCPTGTCSVGDEANYNKLCAIKAEVDCKVFARKRTIKWKNGINPGKGKASRINSKLSFNELKSKLTELGFVGEATSKKETKKITKKKEKKVVEKYLLEGAKSLALSWQGYSDLIAGTIKFEEADYKGTLNLSLPNNDGTCDGSYSLLSDGKGTWQIACTNNMAASGTLKWMEDGGVTGKGKDLNGKNVKFTVSKES